MVHKHKVDDILERISTQEDIRLDKDIETAIKQIKELVIHIFNVSAEGLDKRKTRTTPRIALAKRVFVFLIYDHLTKDQEKISKASHYAISTVKDIISNCRASTEITLNGGFSILKGKISKPKET